MKLLTILATKLNEWPVNGDLCFVQDKDGRIFAGTDPYMGNFKKEWFGVSYYNEISKREHSNPLAEDYQTAIVTKAMWEAEVKRLDSCDVVGETVSSATVDCPRTIRDRIYEINSTVESLTTERESLIELLRQEGFVLVDVTNSGSSGPVSMPTENVPHWRDWQVGDVLEVVGEEEGHSYENGDLIEIVSIDHSTLPFETKPYDGEGPWDWVNHREVKWIRRP